MISDRRQSLTLPDGIDYLNTVSSKHDMYICIRLLGRLWLGAWGKKVEKRAKREQKRNTIFLALYVLGNE